MNTKRYLQQIRMYDTRINAKIAEREHLKDMVTKVTTSLSGDIASGGSNQDKLGTIVSRMVDLEKEIDSDIDKFVAAKNVVNEILEQVENPKEYEVLHKRYVQYNSFETIAVDMGMTYRNICYIHGKALQTVTRIRGEGNE